MRVIKGIVYLFNIMVVIFTLLSYIAPFVDPSLFWAFSFFGLVFPILLFINIFFIIYWYFSEKKKMWLSIIILLIGYGNIVKTFALDFSNENTEKGISILSYNLNHGDYLYKNKLKKGSLGEFLDNQDTDLLLLQEINSKRIRHELVVLKKYKYIHREEGIGTGILSKFPIINSGKIDFSFKTNSCLWADIKIDRDTFRVYSVHFQSNKVSEQASEIVKDIEKDKAIKSKDVRLILSKYKQNVQVRASQVKKVREHINNSPFRVILGGDFNDPSVTYTYQQFAEILKDSFKDKGLGMGISYAGSIPFLRIDYVFISPEIEALDFETLSDKYSDHLAIKSTIKL